MTGAVICAGGSGGGGGGGGVDISLQTPAPDVARHGVTTVYKIVRTWTIQSR